MYVVVPPIAFRPAPGRNTRVSFQDVDHPRDAEAVDEHAERVTPGRLHQRLLDLTAVGELLSVQCPRGSSAESPLSEISIMRPGLGSMNESVSEAMIVKPLDGVSWPCMIFSDSEGSIGMPDPPKVLIVSSPPETCLYYSSD